MYVFIYDYVCMFVALNTQTYQNIMNELEDDKYNPSVVWHIY